MLSFIDLKTVHRICSCHAVSVRFAASIRPTATYRCGHRMYPVALRASGRNKVIQEIVNIRIRTDRDINDQKHTTSIVQAELRVISGYQTGRDTGGSYSRDDLIYTRKPVDPTRPYQFTLDTWVKKSKCS